MYINHINLRLDLRKKILYKKIAEQSTKKIKKLQIRIKNYIFRKSINNILNRSEDNYFVYSSIQKRKKITFEVKHSTRANEFLNFEYFEPIKSYLLLINKKDKKLTKKVMEGNFYDENMNKLFDPLYKKDPKDNSQIINIPQIISTLSNLEDKYDKIISDFLNKGKNKKINKQNLKKSTSLNSLDLFGSSIGDSQNSVGGDDFGFGEIKNDDDENDKKAGLKKSKSMMRLKPSFKQKSILKPSKSFIKLGMKDNSKKVLFGETTIEKL